MRFLFFSAQYLPTVGGVERYTHGLCRALIAMGHFCAVATSALPGLPAHEVDPDGIEIFRLPAALFMRGRFPAPRPGAAFRQAAARLWAQPYDFAVVQTRFYPQSLWAVNQCAKRGLPAIVIEHGTKHLNMENALLNIAGNAYEHAAMRYVRRRCPAFYGVSQACNAWLRHFHVAARGVLYNAVDADALTALAAAPRRDFRAEAGADGGPLIAFIGRFIAEKGIWELLSAFEIIRQSHPGAALVMAGDGPLYAEAAARAQPGVLLTGQLPYAESVALLAACDIFCLPTYSEGFSSTILEAAAVGACIVTTPTGGSPELICDGQSGILLESRSPQAVAGALGRAAADPAWRAQAGKHAQAEVRRRFTWARTAEALLAIAGECVNEAAKESEPSNP